MEHPLFRKGAPLIGVGIGLLIVMVYREAELGTTLARVAGGLGVIILIVGLGMVAAGWNQTGTD